MELGQIKNNEKNRCKALLFQTLTRQKRLEPFNSKV